MIESKCDLEVDRWMEKGYIKFEIHDAIARYGACSLNNVPICVSVKKKDRGHYGWGAITDGLIRLLM